MFTYALVAECPPMQGYNGIPGGQQKKFLPFGHRRESRDLHVVAFNGTGL